MYTVVVVVGGGVVVLVGTPPPHVSQQLPSAPVVPPRPAHEPASRLIRQRNEPLRSMQQDTAPGFPHVDFAAHRLTALRHCDRRPASARVRAMPIAHRT
jgi:hypothetical protein